MICKGACEKPRGIYRPYFGVNDSASSYASSASQSVALWTVEYLELSYTDAGSITQHTLLNQALARKTSNLKPTATLLGFIEVLGQRLTARRDR